MYQSIKLAWACDDTCSDNMQVMSVSLMQPGGCVSFICLAADHPEGYKRYSPMVSRLLQLMIIDIVATRVALRIGSEKLQPLLREMKNNLRNKRHA